MIPDNKTAHLYTALFCEENIWQLARQLVADGIHPETLQVIFISNPQKQVVLFNQRSGAEQGYVVWDYHVILRQYDEEGDHIYDFDTRLSFPCNSDDYLSATFGAQQELQQSYRARLRLIPARDYLQRFYSNRSHMRGVISDTAFPPWPAITPESDQVVRLDAYWDMQNERIRNSRVLSVESFIATEL